MTQSGQGEEPSQRPAREGIVLPSDGGEPLLPGMTGDGYAGAYGPPGGHAAAPQPGQQPPAAAPPGGQAWGTPWGPDQHQTAPPPPGQAWTAPPAQPWGTPEPSGGIPSQPLPAEGTPAPSYGPTDGYGAPAPGSFPPAAGQEAPPTGGYGAPAAGAYGAPGTDGAGAYGYPAAGPQGTDGTGGYGYPAPALGSYDAPAAGSYGSPAGGAPLPAANGYGGPGAGAPLPPADGYGNPAPLPSGGGYGSSAPGGAPLPPADEGATQYIPPIAAAPVADGATQYLRPVAAPPADEGATQYLPPVGPGALPPEVPAESTQFLGRVPQAGQNPGAGPLPPVSHPDAEATQYIAPIPGGQPAGAPYGGGGQDRQPPAEFDNLFRSGPDGESPAASTQYLPRFSQPEAPAYPSAPQPGYAPQGPGGGHRGGFDDGEGGGRGGRSGRSGSRVPVIAAVGIGIAVLGIGAGALLSSGGGGDDKNQTVSATASATTEESASPSADPAKQQAVELDKLLADSGSSRASVISAVANVKACNNLGQAAEDLRAAATQRGELVTRLSGLQVDQLPDHAALTTALTKAWQASASADNHYAAWADQVAGKKGCKKGQARTTPQTQAGNRASGTASAQKSKAAQLWNGIAKTYGLTQRQPTQL